LASTSDPSSRASGTPWRASWVLLEAVVGKVLGVLASDRSSGPEGGGLLREAKRKQQQHETARVVVSGVVVTIVPSPVVLLSSPPSKS
jgi:hypothetical protein